MFGRRKRGPSFSPNPANIIFPAARLKAHVLRAETLLLFVPRSTDRARSRRVVSVSPCLLRATSNLSCTCANKPSMIYNRFLFRFTRFVICNRKPSDQPTSRPPHHPRHLIDIRVRPRGRTVWLIKLRRTRKLVRENRERCIYRTVLKTPTRYTRRLQIVRCTGARDIKPCTISAAGGYLRYFSAWSTT